MVVRLVDGVHFDEWDKPSTIQKKTPKLVVVGESLIPNLRESVCEWINTNTHHPFYLVGVGELTTNERDMTCEGLGEPVEDDHIRFTDAKDFTLFKMFFG